MNLNIGIFIIRLVIGVVFMGHGLQKLTGWFDGNGLLRTAEYFSKLGMSNALLMVILVSCMEVTGGMLLVLGIFTPLAALMLSSVMIGAIIKVHGQNGFWAAQHGFEYNLVLATVSLAIGLTGPGTFTLKRKRR